MSEPGTHTSWYTDEENISYHRNKFSDDPHVRETIARSRARKLQPYISSNDRVLEYGVGAAFNLTRLNCGHKTGYDVTDYGSEACKRVGIDFTTDLTTLEGQKFDVVICHHVLEHVPNPLVSLEEIRGLLVPNGRLILCVPYERGAYFDKPRPGDINHHLYSWNPLSLSNLVGEAGYEIDEAGIGPYGYEQRLAPVAKYGFNLYLAALAAVRLIRPVREIKAILRNPLQN